MKRLASFESYLPQTIRFSEPGRYRIAVSGREAAEDIRLIPEEGIEILKEESISLPGSSEAQESFHGGGKLYELAGELRRQVEKEPIGELFAEALPSPPENGSTVPQPVFSLYDKTERLEAVADVSLKVRAPGKKRREALPEIAPVREEAKPAERTESVSIPPDGALYVLASDGSITPVDPSVIKVQRPGLQGTRVFSKKRTAALRLYLHSTAFRTLVLSREGRAFLIEKGVALPEWLELPENSAGAAALRSGAILLPLREREERNLLCLTRSGAMVTFRATAVSGSFPREGRELIRTEGPVVSACLYYGDREDPILLTGKGKALRLDHEKLTQLIGGSAVRPIRGIRTEDTEGDAVVCFPRQESVLVGLRGGKIARIGMRLEPHDRGAMGSIFVNASSPVVGAAPYDPTRKSALLTLRSDGYIQAVDPSTLSEHHHGAGGVQCAKTRADAWITDMALLLTAQPEDGESSDQQ